MVYVKVVNRAFPLTWPAAMAANFTTGKKKHFAGAFVVTLKINNNKRQSFYHFFQTLTLFSRLSPGLENCLQISFIFSRIQADSVGTLFLTIKHIYWFHTIEFEGS